MPSITRSLAFLPSRSFGFNVLFLLAVAFTSPLTVSVSVVAAIPASALTDWWLHGEVFSADMAVGSVMVLAGFLLLMWAVRREELAAAAATAAAAAAANHACPED